MKPKAYIETTVISYRAARPSRDLLVAAHQRITNEWWDSRREHHDLLISQLVVEEARDGDQQAASERAKLIEQVPMLETTSDVVTLAQALVDDHTIPSEFAAEAIHVAIAAVHGVDYLITWNLKHIANAVSRQRIVEACRRHGYGPPVICTPEELLEE
ncbi:MAG: type II toxin-antitoxin system VapC family toxin [Acidobacteriota bacterium]